MDIKGIRQLNLIGTIIFALFGCGIPLFYMSFFGWMSTLGPMHEGDNPFGWCMFVFLIWLIIVIALTVLIYDNTVKTIDQGDYEKAKRWTVYAMVLAFLFGGSILTLLLFLISYISFDDALRQLQWSQYGQYAQPHYAYPPQQQYGYGYQRPPPQPPPNYPGYAQAPAQQPYQQYSQPPPPPPSTPGRCPHCGNVVEKGWTTCRYCYGKL